jgi:hypothetical protein
MRLPGIGTLILDQDCWQLVYDSCRHTQLVAREGLKHHEDAARDIRRHYAHCLSCRVEAQLMARRDGQAALANRS